MEISRRKPKKRMKKQEKPPIRELKKNYVETLYLVPEFQNSFRYSKESCKIKKKTKKTHKKKKGKLGTRNQKHRQ